MTDRKAIVDRLHAEYYIETPLEVERVAAVIAGEQSSGTFVPVPGETDELKHRFAARVERVEPLGETTVASLPGVRPQGPTYRCARIELSWSVENFGFNLPAVYSTVQGNLYEVAQLSAIRLLDLRFPASFADAFPGPKHGAPGTRRLTGVEGRPLIGTIIKPGVGLSPAQTAELVAVLVEAGVDFIKDDELMADPPHSPLKQRVGAVMRVVNDHAQRTGKRVMVGFNVSDSLDNMLRHYDHVVASGNTCAMVSVNAVGLTGVMKLASHGPLALHGHRNGFGMMHRCPALGTEFAPYQKMWRLAGVDQLHVNGVQNKFWEPDESVVRSMEACRAPLLNTAPVLPVVSSGQWGGQAPETYRLTQTLDLLYMAGGGIAAHPSGPAAGVRAIQHAWQGAAEGLTLEQAAARSPELRQAVERFGGKGGA